MDAQPDSVEHAIATLPPYMQRRMAKLSLAGARFVLDQCAGSNSSDWQVWIGGEQRESYPRLAWAIDDTWLTWLRHLPNKDADHEVRTEQYIRSGVFELPQR